MPRLSRHWLLNPSPYERVIIRALYMRARSRRSGARLLRFLEAIMFFTAPTRVLIGWKGYGINKSDVSADN